MSRDQVARVVALTTNRVMHLSSHRVVLRQVWIDGKAAELANPAVSVEDLKPDALLGSRATSAATIVSSPRTPHAFYVIRLRDYISRSQRLDHIDEDVAMAFLGEAPADEGNNKVNHAE